MHWNKQQVIFKPSGEFGWMNTHAQVPTAFDFDDVVRVYFSTRPQNNISLPAYIDLDPNHLSEIVYTHDQPILELGQPGSFDEHGIMPSCVIANDDVHYMYYTGWNRGTTVPYCNSIGLAVSHDKGKTFEKLFSGPIVDRTKLEPYSAMSPYVLKENSLWHMWYSSGTDWFKGKDKYEPIYIIKYASSKDGIHWLQENKTCIAGKDPLEANTRPSVLKIDGKYHMWFCYRGSQDFRVGEGAYRIGYAHSDNLTDWVRDDDAAGITVSETGWDDKMVEYPQCLATNNGTYMFYNGNRFGAEGFGYAKLENG